MQCVRAGNCLRRTSLIGAYMQRPATDRSLTTSAARTCVGSRHARCRRYAGGRQDGVPRPGICPPWHKFSYRLWPSQGRSHTQWHAHRAKPATEHPDPRITASALTRPSRAPDWAARARYPSAAMSRWMNVAWRLLSNGWPLACDACQRGCATRARAIPEKLYPADLSGCARPHRPARSRRP
jgi:hypothetical protein